MIGFFLRRPRLGLFSVLGFFAAGAVLAHTAGPSVARQLPALVLASQKAPVARRAAPDAWRRQLDLDRLQIRAGKLGQVLPDGTEIITTLDPRLQAFAEKTLADNQLPYGAMVMMDVDSGRVLVAAGHSTRTKKKDTETLTLSPWAPAASVFKLVTASALLSRGVPPEATVCYHGGLRGIDEEHIRNNARLDTACHSLSFGVAKSVNPVLAKLALRYLDRGSLQDWAARFGFNKPIPFELPVEPSRATIPGTRLELARVAAGFWRTEISALHGALIAQVAARDGVMRYPTIVERVRSKDGRTLSPTSPREVRVLGTSTARKLAQMMVRTTTMGTARKGFIGAHGKSLLGDVQVGGKTGSLSRQKPFLHYNWFVGFAPAQNPQVAFAVLLGNPADWRIKAHSAARLLLDQYFEQKKQRDREKQQIALSR